MSFTETVRYPNVRLDVLHNPPLILKLKGTNTTAPPSSEPFIFNLPGKGCGAHLIQDAKEVIIPMNNDQNMTGKALVYDYETGNLKFTFECNNCIMNLKVHHDILFVQLFNAWDILAWNWKTGEKVELPHEWNKVDQLCFSEQFTAHNNFKDYIKPLDKQKPIELIISDPNTLKHLNTIKTGLYKIFDMAIKGRDLYVIGGDDNTSFYRGTFVQSACVIKYENPLNENPERRKVSLYYDVNALSTKVFKMVQGNLLNIKWYASTNYIWDSETLNPQLIRKTHKKSDDSYALSKVWDKIAVIFDDEGMEIYQKENNQFLSLKNIKWENNDTGSSLELFKYNNRTMIAEGYESGIVRIRDAEHFNVEFELKPPENMSVVLGMIVHKKYLLAHYLTPSKEGTLAILWDLNTQKPALLITREALKNRDYKSYNDNIHIVNEDIFVRSEDQVLIYKGVVS